MMQRLIIEMGMGVDLHGMDYTKAAERAMRDAMGHACLPILGRVDEADIDIHVHVGVQAPDAVATDRLAALLPKGKVQVSVHLGGLDIRDPETGETQVVANAAIEVFLPKV